MIAGRRELWPPPVLEVGQLGVAVVLELRDDGRWGVRLACVDNAVAAMTDGQAGAAVEAAGAVVEQLLAEVLAHAAGTTRPPVAGVFV